MLLRPALFVALVALLAAPARAQQEYRFSETDDWTLAEPVDPLSPEGQLAAVRRALAAEQFERAAELATQWIGRFERHPYLPDAYLYRGDAERGRGNYYEALFDYEYVARVFPGSEAFVTALDRELEIARIFASGTKRKLWGLRLVDASDEAEELFIRVQERMPGSSLAEAAGLDLGDFYFTRREMTLAAEAYALFIENYPRSRHIPLARRRLIYAHLASFKGPQFDASGLYEARARLRDLMVQEPLAAQQIGAEALLVRIDESDAAKLLSTARWYLQVNDPIAAEMTIRRLLRRHPGTTAARQALRMIPEIAPALPPAVLAEAPDYAAYQAALLGDEPAAAPTEPAP